LDLQDAAHGSGILSLKHMLLRVKSLAALFAPDRWREQRLREPSSAMWRHAVNILREPFRTAAAAVEVARRRVAWTGRRPDLLARTRAGRYRLAFHAEQAPNDASRVMLGGSRDPFGARAARIDFRYSAEDFAGVVAAHRRLASILSAHGGARLIFDGDDAQLAEQVAAQACDGYHQIGVTRMAADPAFGVVDAESRVFGVANLYIASSSVFPTSGQANPTLSIVAFSFRLAEGLRRKLAPFHARQGRGPSEQAGRFASPPAAAAAAARRA
ncbi:MAG: GMC family oxidoreductase, partial [Pseudomonadota bacterium]